MSNSDEITLDLEELNRLRQLATRPFIKDLLTAEAQRLQSRLAEVTQPMVVDAERSQIEKPTSIDTSASASPDSSSIQDTRVPSTVPSASTAAACNAQPTCISVTKSAPPRYYKDVTTYAWDQSDKFMKIYVTMNGVHQLSKDCIRTEFMPKSFKVKVDDLNGSNYSCHIAGLWGKIVPDQCYYKVKTDSVLVMLKKEEEKKTWAYVTEREDKKKWPPSSFDEKKDPNEGLMDMLKKLYEEGDDEMKRTIAKSWTESRNKQSPGLDL